MENVQKDLEFIPNFKAWMAKENFTIETDSALRLINSKNKNEGRCIISTKDYDSDKHIFSIPFKFLINYRASFKHPNLVEFFEWSLVNSLDYRLTRLDALYLCLMYQRSDSESELYGFIHSMPLEYDTPEYFEDSLLKLLPQNLHNSVEHRINSLENKFNTLKSLLCDFIKFKNKDSSELIQCLVNNFNKDSFTWVFNSVNSRCFHLNDTKICDKKDLELSIKLFGPLVKPKNAVKANASFKEFEKHRLDIEDYNNNMCCLIPYVDMLNHSLEPNCIFYFDPIKKSYTLKSCKIDESSSTAKQIKKDEQVYTTYGFHDNKTLLIEYGFILNENMYDKITLQEDDFIDLAADMDIIELVWVEANGQNLLTNLHLFTEGPSWNVLKILDIIFQMNNNAETSKRHKKLKKAEKTYEINSNADEIKTLFLKVLNKYSASLQKSITSVKLTEAVKNSYHAELVLKFLLQQLDIINSNHEIAQNNDLWLSLF